MNKEEKEAEDDILFDIDMQLYDEFNDKIATMNDYLGDIYSLRDIEEVENDKREKEIRLLRIAIAKLQEEIERLKKKNKRYEKIIEHKEEKCEELLEFVETEKENDYVSKDKIREKIKELENNKKIQLYNKPSVVKQICLANFRELLEE